MNTIKWIYLTLIYFLLVSSCTNKANSKKQEIREAQTTIVKEKNVPSFNADTAYMHISKQVEFGPRVPNTKAHRDCANYLEKQLEAYGAQLYVQETSLKAYDNTWLKIKNIIGIYNPEVKQRILLFAHWDSRPYADHDPDKRNHKTPIDGADDGASGVGVLLEIARQLGLQKNPIGIDIIFFDAEDYGAPTFVEQNYQDDWCLGSQFWAKNPHTPGYTAQYGILLDMVGSKNATFFKEYFSKKYASNIIADIWDRARNLGYGKYFINAEGGAITDDHLYVIQGRNIPCVDIINYDPDTESGFAPYWHTLKDNMENIDKETLHAVGQTILDIIYRP